MGDPVGLRAIAQPGSWRAAIEQIADEVLATGERGSGSQEEGA